MSRIEMIQRNSQKVFRSCPRGRKMMVIGRQDYTSPGSCSFQPDQLQPAVLCLAPGAFVMMKITHAALCRDLIKNNPYSFTKERLNDCKFLFYPNSANLTRNQAIQKVLNKEIW